MAEKDREFVYTFEQIKNFKFKLIPPAIKYDEKTSSLIVEFRSARMKHRTILYNNVPKFIYEALMKVDTSDRVEFIYKNIHGHYDVTPFLS